MPSGLIAPSGSTGTSSDHLKRRTREWDDSAMNTEVYESPDPEVTFQAYAAVAGAGAGRPSSAGGGRRRGTGAGGDEGGGKGKAELSELDEEPVAPSSAFEAFMGKVYKPTSTRLPSQSTIESHGAAAGASARGSKESRVVELESPLQRLTRLALEMKELESDLTLLAESAALKKQDRVQVDAAQEAELGEVLQGLSTLQLNLSAMEQNPQFQPFLGRAAAADGEHPAALAPRHADAVVTLQRELTAQFFQQIDTLKRQQQPLSTGSSGSSSSSTAAPIVYEIYSNGDLQGVERDARSRMVALEARLANLETVVGAATTKELRVDALRSPLGPGGATHLTALVSDMEQRVRLLSEKNLDAIKSRATALVHEFTLLHKLRESPSVQGALQSQADREKLQDLYDTMTRVDAVAGTVPALVERLTTLKSAHDQSVDMSARVQRMERSQERLAELLEADAGVLANMEKSLSENVAVFQGNIQHLDERMARLLAVSRSSNS